MAKHLIYEEDRLGSNSLQLLWEGLSPYSSTQENGAMVGRESREGEMLKLLPEVI